MVPLPVVSAAVWITLECPVLMVGDCVGTLMTRYRGPCGHFTPEAYWYRLVRGLKNGALSLVPVVLVSEPLLEVLAVVPILLASVVLQCWVRPRTRGPARSRAALPPP